MKKRAEEIARAWHEMECELIDGGTEFDALDEESQDTLIQVADELLSRETIRFGGYTSRETTEGEW